MHNKQVDREVDGIRMKLVEKVKYTRTRLGVTQTVVAKNMGISQSIVCRLETRSAVTVSSRFLKYLDTLGLELDVIVKK